jgi:hypothetical protein
LLLGYNTESGGRIEQHYEIRRCDGSAVLKTVAPADCQAYERSKLFQLESGGPTLAERAIEWNQQAVVGIAVSGSTSACAMSARSSSTKK